MKLVAYVQVGETLSNFIHFLVHKFSLKTKSTKEA